jgi:AcrR family transcriptional regulator
VKPQARTRRARGSLSGEEILAAAYELVARDGLDALSMPILARHLGAGVTSLYWYFRNKEELLVALAQQVSTDFYDALPRLGDGPWDEELRAYFLEYRAILARFPVYLDLFAVRPRFVLTRPKVYSMVLQRLDDDVALLVRAGLTPQDAARAHSACNVYTRGFVMLEQGVAHEPEEGAEELHERLVETVEHLDGGAFPTLRALGDVEPVTQLGDEAYASGLDILIEGIRIEIERRATPKRATRTARRRRSG